MQAKESMTTKHPNILKAVDPDEEDVRTKVFLDVAVNGKLIGRVIIGLFSDALPKTCENFRALCTGEKGMGTSIVGKKVPLHFKSTRFHRIIDQCLLQGGDIQNTGHGGFSIYEERKFKDEYFIYRHSRAGVLSMANSGTDSNGSQFFITLGELKQLDYMHVVFGIVLQGLDVLKQLAKDYPTHSVDDEPLYAGRYPVDTVSIYDCGEFNNAEEAAAAVAVSLSSSSSPSSLSSPSCTTESALASMSSSGSPVSSTISTESSLIARRHDAIEEKG